MRGIRSITASRLSYSAQVSPHIYLTISIDMSEMLRWKGKSGPTIEKRLQSKLSLTAMIVFALSRVLTAHPYLNSSLADNEIILWDDVHVGIATALGDDLIVPVVRQAQQLSLEETVKEMNRLFEAARAHKLQPSEMSGSTFTISNLGMFGIEEFTAILNPPEAGILAVGKIVDTPVASAGQVFIRPMMRLTLTTDHRINDGVRAANFLNELKSVLENPYSLL
jgi:pyruvate dehydrogenase E2 component (dihydrolipoamide acetyltransferase)